MVSLTDSVLVPLLAIGLVAKLLKIEGTAMKVTVAVWATGILGLSVISVAM